MKRRQKINNICLKYKPKRRNLNKSIVTYLNKKFKMNPRPNKKTIKQITSKTCLNSFQIKKWFLNKRLKYNYKFNKISTKTYLIYNNVAHWFTYESSEKINLKAFNILFDEYKRNEKPNKQTINKLALKLDLTSKQVNEWFKIPKQCTVIYPNCHKYKGQIKNGKRSGKGIYINSDGQKYNGDWLNNRYHGYGTLNFNGKKYEGEFKNGKRNGKGIHTCKYLKYDGEWKNDRQNGIGTEYYCNGDKYEGEWKDGSPNGNGVEYYANGNKYEGEFKNGKREGKGSYMFNNGNKYEGEWKKITHMMDMVRHTICVALNTKEISKKVTFMAKVFIHGLMEQIILVIGLRAKEMVEEFLHGLTVINMKGIGKMIV